MWPTWKRKSHNYRHWTQKSWRNTCRHVIMRSLYFGGDLVAANMELQIIQKTTLFNLLKLKKANSDYQVKELDGLILATKAAMTQEDVAWVEKNVSQLK